MVAPIVTVRPGPVLHVWQNGRQVAAVALTAAATVTLCRDLMAAMEQPK